MYREVFEKIATEDYEYLEDKDWKAPGFGSSDSDYDEVKTLYSCNKSIAETSLELAVTRRADHFNNGHEGKNVLI